VAYPMEPVVPDRAQVTQRSAKLPTERVSRITPGGLRAGQKAAMTRLQGVPRTAGLAAKTCRSVNLR
jgi:hypothetical protein